MVFLYNAGLIVFYLLVGAGTPFSAKARYWIQGRRGWRKKLQELQGKNEKWVWFHCASAGEFEDGIMFIHAFRQAMPGYRILLTFFSPSGYRQIGNPEGADLTLYLPLDLPHNATQFIHSLNPRMVFFVRNDIWFNYLKILHQRQIPVFHLSLKMHTDSRFLKFPQRFFYARAFSLFNRMYVQTQLTADLLRSLGIPNAEVSGNTRIPRVLKLTQEQEPFAEIREFIGNRFCIIGGSLLPKDEEVFLAAASVLLDQNIVWIAVPHEINSKRMAAWERHYSGRVLTYSNRNRKKEEDILWIDNTGMLSRLYRYAHLAFVGGGYDRIGIHNILEPASFSCPIAFGPRHRNYTEALELLESGGASMVHNSEEWISLIRKYVSQETLRKKDGHGNRNYLLAQTDASENILAGLRKEGYLSTL